MIPSFSRTNPTLHSHTKVPKTLLQFWVQILVSLDAHSSISTWMLQSKYIIVNTIYMYNIIVHWYLHILLSCYSIQNHLGMHSWNFQKCSDKFGYFYNCYLPLGIHQYLKDDWHYVSDILPWLSKIIYHHR